MKYGLPEAFHLLQNPQEKTGMENYGGQESESIPDRLSSRGYKFQKLIKSHGCKHMQNRAVPPSIENSKTKSNRCRLQSKQEY